MADKVKKTVSLLTALVLFTLTLTHLSFAALPVKAETKEINDHKLIASSNAYNLYMRENDLSVVVEDKKTGAFMESAISYDDEKSNKTWYCAMQSAIVITMISGTDDTKQADLLKDQVTKKITYTENGFSAEIFWKKYKFGLTLEAELTDEGFTARIADESIHEDDESYKIGTICMYPYMGVSYLDTKKGYMFIPDGNGALIYLDDKEGKFNSGYSSMIYGSDIGFEDSNTAALLWDRYKTVTKSEQVIAPVFGIAHTDDRLAYLAVVENGAERAIIEGMPNGVSVDYNRVYAKFIERKLYTQPTSNNSTTGSLHITEADRTHSDLKIRYIFLSGDKADYAGMANAYREYLLKNGGLKENDTSYSTRVDFLGSDRESFIIGTTAVVMTTVDDIRDIYADLTENGVDSVLSVYKGWQKKGVNNVPVTSCRVDGKIGSASSLAKLIADSQKEGKRLYLYEDALRLNPDETNGAFNTIKRINKKRYEEKTYMEVYESFYFLTPAKASKNLKSLTGSLLDKNIQKTALAGITNNLFSYYYSGKDYSRRSCREDIEAMVAETDASLELIMEQPFAYLWKNTESFLDMPMYTSDYMYEDEFVPFMSIVLKGVMPVYSEYTNFEANKKEFFLKLVETGTYPSFYITKESSAELIYTNSADVYSSEYEAYKTTITGYHKELSEIAGKTKNAVIKSHDILGNGVTRVGYSNGVTIYVNYSDKDVTVDNKAVKAMSYVISE